MSRNGKVIVAMSGGVDSSVAAALLREQGYDVVGVFMRLGAEPEPATACATDSNASGGEGADSGSACSPERANMAPGATSRASMAPGATSRSPGTSSRSLPLLGQPDRTRGCCSASDAADARSVAARLDIPFYALNFAKEFDRLKDNFADEYVRGRTPNPCVRCNQWLKFGRLDAYARVMDAEWIATGHYARIRHESIGPRLFRAADREKDQSYVLFGVATEVLARTLFPLGDLDKPAVRAEGRRLGLTVVHDKAESQDICFVPDGDYFGVVQARRPEAHRPGEIRHVDGRVLGRHEGVASLTIGQRRGLGVAAGHPIYVTGLDAETATVTVGPREALGSCGLIATDVNWLPIAANRDEVRATVQVRYHHAGAPGVVRRLDADGLNDMDDASAARRVRCADHSTTEADTHSDAATSDTEPRRVRCADHHAANAVSPHDAIPSSPDWSAQRTLRDAESCDDATNNAVRVEFNSPVDAVTPGQAAVFYDGDEVLGGGWIERGIGGG